MRWILFVACLFRPIFAVDLGVPVGEFRGVNITSQMLKDTVIADPNFQLLHFVPSKLQAIANQMGSFSGTGKDQRFINGQSNALNAVLWTKTLHNFVKYVLSATAQLRDTTKTAIANCKAAKSESQIFDCLDQLWEVFLFSSLPPIDQKQSWMTFFKDEMRTQSWNEKMLEDALLTAFLNPYFIFKN